MIEKASKEGIDCNRDMFSLVLQLHPLNCSIKHVFIAPHNIRDEGADQKFIELFTSFRIVPWDFNPRHWKWKRGGVEIVQAEHTYPKYIFAKVARFITPNEQKDLPLWGDEPKTIFSALLKLKGRHASHP